MFTYSEGNSLTNTLLVIIRHIHRNQSNESKALHNIYFSNPVNYETQYIYFSIEAGDQLYIDLLERHLLQNLT